MSSEKLCKDCVHQELEDKTPVCTRTTRGTNKVTGESYGHFACATERVGFLSDDCGPTAKYFQLKAEYRAIPFATASDEDIFEACRQRFFELSEEYHSLGFWARIWRTREFEVRIKTNLAIARMHDTRRRAPKGAE